MVAKALVGKLGKLLSDEYRLLRGVRGGVIQLKDEVAIMNALLRMLAEADDGAVSHFVREWMKQVRELTYDAEDCIDLFVRRVSVVGRPNKLAAARHLLATLAAGHRLAADILALRARAVAISERRARYGVDSQALRPSAYFAHVAAVVTANPAGIADEHGSNNNQLVGMDGQVKSLSDKLRPAAAAAVNGDGGGAHHEHGKSYRTVKVFSIVGFGGLGKTTLAKLACQSLEEEFTCQATVSVSQAFDATKDMADLLKRILYQVVKLKSKNQKGIQQEAALGNVESMDKSTLSRNLVRHLKDKRYLIVIDDVWTIPAWHAIRSELPENSLSSRIIVTTRIEGVAKACSPPSCCGEDNIHRMKPLESGDSQKLFVDRVFGLNATCPDGLKEKMELILKKCGGLPLAIVSIASLLSSYRSPGSIDMWERIHGSIGSQMESNPTLEGMRQIITLSYNHLPQHLKACMMYLSIFPEDYVIKKKRLMYRWVAEGLVVQKRGLTLLEVAESYFEELMGRNMIDPSNIRSDGAITACRVHDMMLEVVVSKSLEENFVTLVGGQQSASGGALLLHDNVRRISIHGDDDDDGDDNAPRISSNVVRGMDVKHIRSMSTFRADGRHHRLLDRLPEFTLLRVLDLEGCKYVKNHHMKVICALFLLRFLSLRYTDVSVMPGEIDRLRHLQTLNLHGTSIPELPQSVTNLEALEYLYFTNKNAWDTLWRLPRGLGKMKALRLARKVDLIDDVQVAGEIGKLAQLRDIEFVLRCNDQQVLKHLAGSLSRLRSLRTLKVADHDCESAKANFLLDLEEPPPLLQSLRISGIMARLPAWFESHKHLATVKLCYLHLRADQIYPVLYKLPNLMRIHIEWGTCIDPELAARADYKFSALRDLRVTPSRDDNPVVIKFEQGSMERLEKLMVQFGTDNRRLLGFENLKSLKEVTFKGAEDNQALHKAVTEVKAWSSKRLPNSNSDEIKVIVQYQ